MAEGRGWSIEAVEKSLGIVDGLGRLGGVGVMDVPEAVDPPPQHGPRTPQSVTERGYVHKQGRTYPLSFRLLKLGGRLGHDVSLYRNERR
jgi:DNA-binding IclR family transcriptional regulator